MKVAFLTNFIPPHQTAFLFDLSKRFDDFVVMVSTDMEPNRNWEVAYQDIKVIRQKTITQKRTWHHPKGFNEVIYVHFPYDTLFQLVRYKPDVIVTSELGFRTVMAGIYRIFFPSSRLVLNVQISSVSEQGRGKFRNLIRRILLPMADDIIVIGNSGKQYVINFGVKEEKVHIIKLAVENELFDTIIKNAKEHDGLRMLFVGRLVPLKGLVGFIDNLSKFLARHTEYLCELWIVGSGELSNIIMSSRIPENLNLRFFGEIPYSNLSTIYHQVDLMVFPTLSDVWGYVVNEAMASGLPVFGSKYSQAVEELIVDQKNGWVFDPLDNENTLEKLSELFEAPFEKIHEMGEQAYSTISNVTVKKMVEQFEAVISSGE